MAKDLWDLSDEELEVEFRAAKEELSSGVAEFQDEDVPTEGGEEEIEVDEPEQPIEDSVTDTNENANENSGEDPVDPDGDVEGQPEPVVEEVKPKVQEEHIYKVKANGQEFDFKIDELLKLAPKAMDYTKKTQELAKWRKTISALTEHNVGHDDVNLLIDVLKGDKNALASVMKRTGVDALELDTENVIYTPKEYGKDATELAIQDVINKYEDDADFGITADVIANKLDEKSKSEFFKDPKLIEALHEDVKAGDFKPVFAEMQKLKALDGGSRTDLEYYIAAGKQYHTRNDLAKLAQANAIAQATQKTAAEKIAEAAKIAEVKAQTVKREQVKQEAPAKKAAAPTVSKTTNKVVDYLDDSDEKYEEWYRNLKASY